MARATDGQLSMFDEEKPVQSNVKPLSFYQAKWDKNKFVCGTCHGKFFIPGPNGETDECGLCRSVRTRKVNVS